ncbi:uncharacterized protein LOC117401331 [Acipenser ruthenus]|uniref:uncharacterized protein LOC117401331 n=1 Tax=Acipenser ruthenus TaxID=7906 RepID=UPI00155FE60D|nr:uncharacterized protein LOC117401331 [Acipenser ruthenus]
MSMALRRTIPLLLLFIRTCSSTDCGTDATLDWAHLTARNLQCRNRNISTIIHTNHSVSNLAEVDLSNNKLTRLQHDFLVNTTSLKTLNLSHNLLVVLPSNFLERATNLKHLNLEGNPLNSVPSTIFENKALQQMVVDCRCDVVQSAITHCQNCSSFLKCSSNSNLTNVYSFYEEKCSISIILAVSLSLAFLVVAVVVIGAVIWRLRSTSKTITPSCGNKEVANRSPEGQNPRYAATTMRETFSQNQFYENVEVAATAAAQKMEYESVGMSTHQQAQGQPPQGDDECYMQYEPQDEAIYNNDPSVYYNYSSSANPTDDVYIMPDQ